MAVSRRPPVETISWALAAPSVVQHTASIKISRGWSAMTGRFPPAGWQATSYYHGLPVEDCGGRIGPETG
jgi:hypothetical protein